MGGWLVKHLMVRSQKLKPWTVNRQLSLGSYFAELEIGCGPEWIGQNDVITQRVALGGHSVPKEKVFGRYQRSLRYLSGMIQLCYRAYFFDNSTTKLTFLGEATPDGFLDIVEESFDNVQPMWLYKNVMTSWDENKIRMIQPR